MDYTKIDEYLGNALYESRSVKRLTQNDMAAAITKKMKANGRKKGITRSGYAFYEKGERSMPSYVFTYACEVLGIDEDKIFNDACDFVKRKQKK